MRKRYPKLPDLFIVNCHFPLKVPIDDRTQLARQIAADLKRPPNGAFKIPPADSVVLLMGDFNVVKHGLAEFPADFHSSFRVMTPAVSSTPLSMKAAAADKAEHGDESKKCFAIDCIFLANVAIQSGKVRDGSWDGGVMAVPVDQHDDMPYPADHFAVFARFPIAVLPQ